MCSVRASERSQIIKRLAKESGFEACGIALPGPIGREGYYREWLSRGYGGTMEYLGRQVEVRVNPVELMPEASSVVVVAKSYRLRDWKPADTTTIQSEGKIAGQVASYAWGRDYHVTVRERLEALAGQMRMVLDEPFEARICVDTSPVVEREWAEKAGIGWIGKNTLVMNRELGSFFFLGVMLTTLELQPDAPVEGHCGTCTACLDACPTSALVAPHQMDASRCISYLTIEHRGSISEPLRKLMGEWIFGCDICQDVCPFNHKATVAGDGREADGDRRIDVEEVLAWDEDAYRARLRGTAMRRAKLAMWKRNAEIVRENRISREGCEGVQVHGGG